MFQQILISDDTDTIGNITPSRSCRCRGQCRCPSSVCRQHRKSDAEHGWLQYYKITITIILFTNTAITLFHKNIFTKKIAALSKVVDSTTSMLIKWCGLQISSRFIFVSYRNQCGIRTLFREHCNKLLNELQSLNAVHFFSLSVCPNKIGNKHYTRLHLEISITTWALRR